MRIVKTKLAKMLINDRHIPVEVSYQFQDDLEPVDTDVESDREKIESGEILSLLVSVEARALGFTGLDTLGQVFVHASNVDEEVIGAAEFHDMEETAINDLRDMVLSTYETLKKVIG